jgi:hypothetical protein
MYLETITMKKIISFSSLFFLLILLPYNIKSQDIQAIIDAQEIDTMLYSGPKDNRINWVIQNRGNSFTDKEAFTAAYRDDLLRAFDNNGQLAQAPYAQYRNFFNLYSSWWPEALDDNSGWSWDIIKQTRDAFFLPWTNDRTGWITWFSSTAGGGGGGAGLDRDRRVGDGKMFGMGYETFLHEFGHTMPGLLDEYSSDASWSGGQCWETGNTSGQLTRDEIPWRNWIDEDTPIPTPYTAEYLDKFGAFEGAMTNYFNCHRPTARSCFMGAGGFGEDYGLELCSVCKQRVICYIYQYVDVIENAFPTEPGINIEGEETITFSVAVVKPEPNTQSTAWVLNGKTIVENTETITLTFESCEAYELKYTVLDENPLVKYDPKFEEIYPRPYQEHTWLINNAEATGTQLVSSETVTSSDCTVENTGTVLFDVSGGEGPYTIHMDGNVLTNPVGGLSAGMYAFDIVDANGCAISKSITIESEALLNPTICSSIDANGWNLKVENKNYEASQLNYQWSEKSITQTIGITQSGLYQVTVTNAEGCSAIDVIEVLFDSEGLQASETVIPSGLNATTGRIYLDISGGRAPYDITWEDQKSIELTDTNTDNIISSGVTWGHFPEFAFDNNIFEKWLHAVSEDAYIGYVFNGPTVVSRYKVTSADDVPERDPRNWQLQGSENGVDWITLDVENEHIFDDRFQEKTFLIDSPAAYTHYRFFVKNNYGDIATQIGELEFIGVDTDGVYEGNNKEDGAIARTSLESGAYKYTVKDQNGSAVSNVINLGIVESFIYPNLNVITNESCDVRVENPSSLHDYYWFGDKGLSEFLNVGDSFRPSSSGNYFVAAIDKINNVMSDNIKGFAVNIATTPEIDTIANDGFSIVAPQNDMEYYWYEDESCGTPLHIGNSFFPSEVGTYYATAQNVSMSAVPIDPLTVDGMLIRMDASDIDGDGVTDQAIPNGEGYDWLFTPNNGMTDDGWFAYRSAYQNGLGIADFGTIWFQGIDSPIDGYQTIIMAYEENPISFPERAPFSSLANDIPKHENGTQIYSNNAPDRTLSGRTYVNGQEIDPLTTSNEMEFMILATAMTEPAPNAVLYTDTQWEGKIGELLLYDRALTDSEIKGISSYLSIKWLSIGDLDSERVPFSYSETVSTQGIEEVTRPFLYPNPTDDFIQLSNLKSGSRVDIYTQDGRVIYSEITTSTDAQITVSNLVSGLYFVRIYDEASNRMYVEKFVRK